MAEVVVVGTRSERREPLESPVPVKLVIGEMLRNSGAQVRELPAEERAQWARSLRDFPDRMAKEADSRGMPGSAVLATYIEAVSQSGYDWPVDYVID